MKCDTCRNDQRCDQETRSARMIQVCKTMLYFTFCTVMQLVYAGQGSDTLTVQYDSARRNAIGVNDWVDGSRAVQMRRF